MTRAKDQVSQRPVITAANGFLVVCRIFASFDRADVKAVAHAVAALVRPRRIPESRRPDRSKTQARSRPFALE